MGFPPAGSPVCSRTRSKRYLHGDRTSASSPRACAVAAPLTLKAEFIELRRQVWDRGLVLAAAADEFNALQQIVNHLVDDGGERRRLPQLQHLGVQDTADAVPLGSGAGDTVACCLGDTFQGQWIHWYMCIFISVSVLDWLLQCPVSDPSVRQQHVVFRNQNSVKSLNAGKNTAHQYKEAVG